MKLFDVLVFLLPPTFEITAAARMALTGLDINGIVGVQSILQIQHWANVRHKVPQFGTSIGGFIITESAYSLCIVDSILPEDYIRRTVICMDTEIEYRSALMRAASGLMNSHKKDD